MAPAFYSRLKTFHVWISLPLAMIFAGLVLGAALHFSNANPVVAVGTMGVVGTIIAPFTSIRRNNRWLEVLLVVIAPVLFFVAAFGIVIFDSSLGQHVERVTQLALNSFLALLFGIWWLSKGWRLLIEGIASQSPEPSVLAEERRRGTSWRYVSLCLGLTVLTVYLGVLAWSASSNWAYGPQKLTVGSNTTDSPLLQFVAFGLFSRWPYWEWKKILANESNSEPEYLLRHKRVTWTAGMLFTVALVFSVTFGTQNGSDRLFSDEITNSGAKFTAVATQIGKVKQRHLRTTKDYIQAYSQVELLQPDFHASIQEFRHICSEGRGRDGSRGPINIQRFYRTHNPAVWQNLRDLSELGQQFDDLTKSEVLAVKNMAALPEREQRGYWESHFRPLTEQEDALREKMALLATKMHATPN